MIPFSLFAQTNKEIWNSMSFEQKKSTSVLMLYTLWDASDFFSSKVGGYIVSIGQEKEMNKIVEKLVYGTLSLEKSYWQLFFSIMDMFFEDPDNSGSSIPYIFVQTLKFTEGYPFIK
jgi:hypothetical protein